jgi:hypothetical protein
MISQSVLNFYKKNKDLKWKMPELPSGIESDYDIADWLLNKSDFGWLELDIEIDLDAWKTEAEKSKHFLVPHRENDSNGWNSSCIHGIDVHTTGAWTNYGYTDENQVPYNWTSISSLTPSIKKFWTKFPYDSYRRIRFMEVVAGGSVNPHSDMPGRLPGEDNFDALKFGVPVNVAIIHPDHCHMTLEGYGCIPWKEGKAFIINIRNYHSVINLSDKSRMHLIAHGKLDKRVNEFTELVARSYKKQYEQTR